MPPKMAVGPASRCKTTGNHDLRSLEKYEFLGIDKLMHIVGSSGAWYAVVTVTSDGAGPQTLPAHAARVVHPMATALGAPA